MIPHENQAITARHGEAFWLTDFITPDNPDVKLLHQRITEGIIRPRERLIALWKAIALIPYREFVRTELFIEGRKAVQDDTWLFPAEVIGLAPAANCACKSFLLTSLFLNENVHALCALGYVTNGIRAHAWVVIEQDGISYIFETTQPGLANPFVSERSATIYKPAVFFSHKGVWVSSGRDISMINDHFGFCAIKYLENYLCERCLAL